jgi:hypothetical protein
MKKNWWGVHIVTGNLNGALVVGTQSIKGTKSLANDTGTVNLVTLTIGSTLNYT